MLPGRLAARPNLNRIVNIGASSIFFFKNVVPERPDDEMKTETKINYKVFIRNEGKKFRREFSITRRGSELCMRPFL